MLIIKNLRTFKIQKIRTFFFFFKEHSTHKTVPMPIATRQVL